MSHTSLFNADTPKSAYIRDDALILYFDLAETPLVARFDLDSLAQANFEVTKRGDIFVLVLRDFSGMKQEITTFVNKADAHQALYSILQALLSYGENKKDDEKKPSLLWKILKWLFIVVLAAVAVAVGLIWLSTPVSHTKKPEKVAAAIPEASAPVVSNEGEPMDMEQFMTPSSVPPVNQNVQTGVMPDMSTLLGPSMDSGVPENLESSPAISGEAPAQ